MESIKQWLLCLCGATAITGIFQVFLSNTSFKKAINIFLSVFVLFYTIIPLSDIESTNINFDLDTVDMKEFFENNYEEVIKTTVKSVCEDNSVGVISIDVDSYMDDDYLIVEKIIVETDTPDKSKILENILKNQFRFEVSVY